MYIMLNQINIYIDNADVLYLHLMRTIINNPLATGRI